MTYTYNDGGPDYAWWEAHGRSVKARLTRAERIVRTDPEKALAEAEAVRSLMDDHGYPDWWARVERLATDAHWARNWRNAQGL